MTDNLDEIIFEGRNKDYGAYPLRKGYQRLVIRIFLISAVLFALPWIIYLVYDNLHPEKDDFDINMVIMYEDMVSMYGEDIPLPPPPENKEPQQSMVPMIPKTFQDAPPQIVDRKDSLRQLKIEKRHTQMSDTAKGDHFAVQGEGGEGNDSSQIYVRVERLPEFPGGRAALDKFLRDNIKYPPSLKDKKLAGVVHISFVIDSRGRAQQVKVIRSLDPMIDAEAVRVIKMMPVWLPGRRYGQAVNVLLKLPIRFLPYN